MNKRRLTGRAGSTAALIKHLGSAVLLYGLLAAGPLRPAHAQAAHRRALLIGAWDYHAGAFPKLHTQAEVTVLAGILTTHFGFDRVTQLTKPSETTRAAILASFTDLIAATQPHDVVYIHYSGHGSEAPDPKDPQTGLDQTIVPTDYTNDGARDIPDKTLAGLLRQLVARKPDSVLVTLDCCHSGTLTRGENLTVRGRPWAARTGQTGFAAGSGGHSVPALLLTTGQVKDGGFVVLSACRDDEDAIEDRYLHMGRFTAALIDALRKARPDTTCGDLFDRVAGLMTNRYSDLAGQQTPQMEGDPQRMLMSGTARPPDRSLPVFLERGKGLVLQAGMLQGMTAGSRFALYPLAAADLSKARPLATATLASVTATASVLRLNPSPVGADPAGILAAKALETSHRYGDLHLRVDPRDLARLPQGIALQAELAKNPLVTTRLTSGQMPDILFQPVQAAPAATQSAMVSSSVRLERFRDGSLLALVPDGPDQARKVSEALEHEARWQGIKGLQNTDAASIGVYLKIVPVEPTWNAKGVATGVKRELPLAREADSGKVGQPKLSVGTCFILKVRVITNGTILHPFVEILDLQGPNEHVGQLWPSKGDMNRDNQLSADGQWRTIGGPNGPTIYEAKTPDGLEVFKAIATKEWIDYAPLLDSALSQGARGQMTPLCQLIRDAATGTGIQTRGPAVSVSTGDWATTDLTFFVVEK